MVPERDRPTASGIYPDGSADDGGSGLHDRVDAAVADRVVLLGVRRIRGAYVEVHVGVFAEPLNDAERFAEARAAFNTGEP